MATNNDYIQLQEAAKLCEYSQEYLSLRARQGKLKAVKFGRNWMTKKDWLKEYLAGAEQYHDFIESKKKEKKTTKILSPVPPANLPIERMIEMKCGLGDIRPSLVVILVIILLGLGGLSEKTNLLKSYSYLSPYVAAIGQAGDFLIQDAGRSLSEVSQDIQELSDNIYLAALDPEENLKYTNGILGEFSQWLQKQDLKVVLKKISN